MTSQYALRSIKSLELKSGSPEWTTFSAFIKPTVAARTFCYSKDGRFFASATSNGVQVVDAATGNLQFELPLKTAIDISLSPNGNYLQTWERHVKGEGAAESPRNLKVWSSTGEELASFSQKAMDGWAIQFTKDESRAVRIVTNEVHVYNPADFSLGIIDKLRLEGVTSFNVSPGLSPSLGLFVAEKKGAPASVKIHSLASLSTLTSSKTFYKADKIQMKWNSNGTSLLFLTQTEVDKTGKSYYGETNLYMMNAAGSFDCRVTLDREGGIQDFAWSPNDKEFSVTYGFMPAKTVIFDQRVNLIHDFGTSPRNTLHYNPQGRLLCIAGFGNLAGQMDIWDRKTLVKVATIEAPNTSYLEWSPDGRSLLCATLSPRLRVDNGVRIFHYSGTLLHVESIEELYQASWRPASADLYPFTGPLDAAPVASGSVAIAPPAKPAAATGAYRPPGARGTLTPVGYKREDEGGLFHSSNGSSAFPISSNGRTSPTFGSKNRRTIPGAAAVIPTDHTNGVVGANEVGGESRKKKKELNQLKKKRDSPFQSGTTTPSFDHSAHDFKAPINVVPVVVQTKESLEAEAALSADDKKRRALMKKLTAIDALKLKKAGGEKLELTQHKKLDSEAEIRRDLAALGI